LPISTALWLSLLSGNLLGFLNPIKLVTYFCQPGLGVWVQLKRLGLGTFIGHEPRKIVPKLHELCKIDIDKLEFSRSIFNLSFLYKTHKISSVDKKAETRKNLFTKNL
jgi:hypothetical protein